MIAAKYEFNTDQPGHPATPLRRELFGVRMFFVAEFRPQ